MGETGGYSPIGKIRITYTGPVPCEYRGHLTQREFNRIVRDAWQPVGAYWHDHLHDKHFSQAGAREYGYQPRKGETGNPDPYGFWASYSGEKQKRLGHHNPNVLSGELQMFSQVYRVVATATSKGSEARIVLPRAQKANLLGRYSKVNMRAELTTVSAQEAPAVVEIHNRAVEAALRQITTVTTKEF